MNPDIEIIEIIEQTTLTIREEAKTESVPERMGKASKLPCQPPDVVSLDNRCRFL